MLYADWQNPLVDCPHVSEIGIKFVSQRWKEKWEKTFKDHAKWKYISDARKRRRKVHE